MRLALYEPDIPQNAGTLLRLAACLGLGADIIEPCGFALSDRHLRRAGMDYLDAVDLRIHPTYDAFRAAAASGRLVLLTTAGDVAYHRAAFRPDDVLMVGRETCGVPRTVHADAGLRVRIPMARDGSGAPLRSLNVAAAAAMVAGEALRQTGGFDRLAAQDINDGVPL